MIRLQVCNVHGLGLWSLLGVSWDETCLDS